MKLRLDNENWIYSFNNEECYAINLKSHDESIFEISGNAAGILSKIFLNQPIEKSEIEYIKKFPQIGKNHSSNFSQKMFLNHSDVKKYDYDSLDSTNELQAFSSYDNNSSSETFPYPHYRPYYSS